MKILLEIPKEFEEHFKNDRFEDSLCRLSIDAHSMAGNYEQETSQMLIEAFRNSTTLPKGHGRLGDLDALEKEMVNGIKAGNCEDGYEMFANINNIDDCVDCVRYADTIIEADIGDTNE